MSNLRVLLSVRARVPQQAALRRLGEEKVAGLDQLLVSGTVRILQVETEARIVAEARDRGRRQREHLAIRDPGAGVHGAAGDSLRRQVGRRTVLERLPLHEADADSLSFAPEAEYTGVKHPVPP